MQTNVHIDTNNLGASPDHRIKGSGQSKRPLEVSMFSIFFCLNGKINFFRGTKSKFIYFEAFYVASKKRVLSYRVSLNIYKTFQTKNIIISLFSNFYCRGISIKKSVSIMSGDYGGQFMGFLKMSRICS